MKELFEKIGLSEFFSYVCPGVILLSSLTFWIWPDFKSEFWKQQVLVTFLGFVFSYMLGLVLASFNDMAQVRYPCSARREQRKLLRHIRAMLIRLFCRFPSPQYNPSIVQANLSIAEDLERLSGLAGLSNLATPWDRLLIYRTLKNDQVGKRCKAVLSEASNLHRRFRFCMGMALAIFLLAVQSLIRLILLILGHFFPDSIITYWNMTLPIDYPWLIVISIVGIWASVELRHVAIRMWELERYLTASLASKDCR